MVLLSEWDTDLAYMPESLSHGLEGEAWFSSESSPLPTGAGAKVALQRPPFPGAF